MSTTQLAVGVAALSMIGSGIVSLVLPQPAPFIVNGLRMDAGIITQDRTITTDQTAFYAQWAATVEDATGESIRRCEGSGANAYSPGRKAVTFRLEDWTGKPGCTWESLPPGLYALRASWRAGEWSTSIKSETFEVTR